MATATGETIFFGTESDYGSRGTTLGSSLGNYNSGGTYAGSSLEAWENNVGKKCSIVHIGTRWKSNGSFNLFSSISAALDINAARGVLTMLDWLAWDSPGHTRDYELRLSEIAAGTHNAYIDAWAAAAAAWNKPLIIRWGHEPNIGSPTPAFSWQYGKGSSGLTFTDWQSTDITNVTNTTNPTISSVANGYVNGQPIFITGVGGATGVNGAQTVLVASTNSFTITHAAPGVYTSGGTTSATWTNTVTDYIAAHRLIMTRFALAGATKVKIAWCLNVQSTSAGLTFAQQYPGDDYTDIISLDGYTGAPSGFLPDLQSVFRGDGSHQDSYALAMACDSTGQKPFMIGETGFFGTVGSPVALTSLTAVGTAWSVVTSSPMDATAIANCAFDVVGVSPSTYNGEWNIASTSDSTHFVLTGDAGHGAATVGSATVQVIDRVNRALGVTKSLELDLTTYMPKLKYLLLFQTSYSASKWCMDYDSSQPNNIDFQALKKALGGAKFLAGGTIKADIGTLQTLPYQDQPDVASFERFLAVRRSMSGLVGLWLNNEAALATQVLDYSGNARHSASVNGTVTFGSTNVILAQPTYTSITFPGATGNNVTFTDDAAYSVATTGKFTLEVTWFAPNAPGATMTFVSKYGTSQGEFEFSLLTTPTHRFVLRQISASTYVDYNRSVPGTFAGVHHTVYSVDTTLATPVQGYTDGTALSISAASVGSMGDGTAPLMFGQLATVAQPCLAGFRLGSVAIWNTAASAESAMDLWSSFVASPVVSALAASPTATTSSQTWTTDTNSSTQIEYGTTTGYGTLSPYDNQRGTDHGVTLTGLTPSTLYHYRIRSRNRAGTETVGADQTFTSSASGTAIIIPSTSLLLGI